MPRVTRHLEVMKILFRQDGFEDTRKLGPVLEGKVTCHSYQHGIESQSWIHEK